MTDEERLLRVGTLALGWTHPEQAAPTRATGDELLRLLRERPAGEDPAIQVGMIRVLAQGWMTPGSAFFIPAAGQLVLFALDGLPRPRKPALPAEMRQRLEKAVTSARLADEDGVTPEGTGALCALADLVEELLTAEERS